MQIDCCVTTEMGFRTGAENTRVLFENCPGDNIQSFASGLELNGYKDWHIPSVVEAATMLGNAVFINQTSTSLGGEHLDGIPTSTLEGGQNYYFLSGYPLLKERTTLNAKYRL
ncbi:hypothetical protein J8281_16935 [Aquimarina sp. U1-2]|uniref:hypothetical protein n=1 Tax=Aquimarina sp. U1-2 TaxID=2823141 RepID=UPI001AECF7B9|nr:hypothetical protein [Aquimarina sp. U1-2]MBP2833884.1 hypothetical protein [Aquimarina sp. U1-2]